MDKNQAPSIFKLLSNDLRWQLLNALSQSDRRVQELVDSLGQSQNLVSYHLQKLHAAGLVIEHQSIADGREIYYGINLSQIRALFRNAQDAIHPGLTGGQEGAFPNPPLRILFLCTHNSARSQMAEGFLRTKAHQQIAVFSAGIDPKPINPNSIRVMAELAIDIRGQQSKDQKQFLDQAFDYVITVCDRAREACPVFPGNPVKIHWSIADPTAVTGSPESRLQAYRAIAGELDERVNSFLAGISIPTKPKEM